MILTTNKDFGTWNIFYNLEFSSFLSLFFPLLMFWIFSDIYPSIINSTSASWHFLREYFDMIRLNDCTDSSRKPSVEPFEKGVKYWNCKHFNNNVETEYCLLYFFRHTKYFFYASRMKTYVLVYSNEKNYT